MGVKLSNGLNPPSKNVHLDNGVEPSAFDHEEQYEKHGSEREKNPPKFNGNDGRKLEKKMNRKYPQKNIRYSEHR